MYEDNVIWRTVAIILIIIMYFIVLILVPRLWFLALLVFLFLLFAIEYDVSYGPVKYGSRTYLVKIDTFPVGTLDGVGDRELIENLYKKERRLPEANSSLDYIPGPGSKSRNVDSIIDGAVTGG